MTKFYNFKPQGPHAIKLFSCHRGVVNTIGPNPNVDVPKAMKKALSFIYQTWAFFRTTSKPASPRRLSGLGLALAAQRQGPNRGGRRALDKIPCRLPSWKSLGLASPTTNCKARKSLPLALTPQRVKCRRRDQKMPPVIRHVCTCFLQYHSHKKSGQFCSGHTLRWMNFFGL